MELFPIVVIVVWLVSFLAAVSFARERNKMRSEFNNKMREYQEKKIALMEKLIEEFKK